MLNIDNKNICEFCFEEVPAKGKKCPHCSRESNILKYPTALPEGTILVGRYSVGKVLGKGGFGITYLCYDLKEKKKVAIKEYLPDSLAHRNSGETIVTTYDGETAEHFKNGAEKFYEEAKLVARFNGNPNIISVYEFFYENNTTYFVMEYLSGMDMKRYWQKNNKKIPEGEVLYIAKRAAEALMIVHSTATLHRDISPDNIFLCDNGDVKLIDFGAARHVVADVSKSLSVILKHGFAPLEQYQRKGKQGPWTDIYALGASLYLALTGNLPDDAMSRLEEPDLDLGGIDPAFAAVINKMMAVKASDRYQNMFAVKNDLDALEIEASAPKIAPKVRKSFCKKCGTEIPVGETLCEQCKKPTNNPSVIQTKETKKTPGRKSKRSILLKISAICAAVVLLIGGIAVFSLLPPTKGTTGSVDWKYDSGVLTISGNGPMGDYESSVDVPWYEIRDKIEIVNIEPGVTRIGNMAFAWCESLAEITIPHSVVSIEKYAFWLCESLVNITIPSCVTDIGDYAFANCVNLKTVIIENKSDIVSIGTKAFPAETNVTYSYEETISVPEEVIWNHDNGILTISGNGPMMDYEKSEETPCYRVTGEIQTAIIEHGVTSIGDRAFYYCRNLTNISIPKTVISIGNRAFYYCSSLKKVSIPNSVTRIGDYAFWRCESLTNITIPNSVTHIGEKAFRDCTGLTSITIPDSVTYIGAEAFAFCDNLTTIIIENKEGNVTIGADAFPDGAKVTYTK